ncbi:hypothetical protein M0R72_07105 [Candidatus Pacearchaeota archaeon]|nr:hypothetical protein [Candidatus Pacearchaeota archaeon]
MENLGEVLESVKQTGAYRVMCYYGEGVGCDDMDIPGKDRHIRIIWSPVGCLGEVRCMWYGKLSDALAMDFKTAVPVRTSNPPKAEEIKGDGYWAWGAGSIEQFMNRFK